MKEKAQKLQNLACVSLMRRATQYPPLSWTHPFLQQFLGGLLPVLNPKRIPYLGAPITSLGQNREPTFLLTRSPVLPSFARTDPPFPLMNYADFIFTTLYGERAITVPILQTARLRLRGKIFFFLKQPRIQTLSNFPLPSSHKTVH